MGTLKFNQWQNPDGTENYKCRAWVNFNGSGTVAIRGSGNVSSITDNGLGNYTVNFSTAMPDVNYSAIGMIIGLNGNSPGMHLGNSITNTSVQLRTMDMANFGDPSVCCLSIFR
jgi:hypothetical protein